MANARADFPSWHPMRHTECPMPSSQSQQQALLCRFSCWRSIIHSAAQTRCCKNQRRIACQDPAFCNLTARHLNGWLFSPCRDPVASYSCKAHQLTSQTYRILNTKDMLLSTVDSRALGPFSKVGLPLKHVPRGRIYQTSMHAPALAHCVKPRPGMLRLCSAFPLRTPCSYCGSIVTDTARRGSRASGNTF